MAAIGGTALTELIELSGRLGREPLWVQGSTGNTSIKVGQTLWIKASGKWLANATNEDMFVPVDRQDVKLFHSRGLNSSPASGLTPSIETPMHLVLPYRVVIHLHSVNTIAWAVQRNGPSYLRERLNGLNWRWIAYAFSGVPLAKAIQASLHCSPDIFILANHGLVIGAETCEQALSVLLDIERRLHIEPRKVPEANRLNLERWAIATDYRLPDADIVHSLGTDAISTALVSRGILYPCQALFLGRRPCLVPVRGSTEQTIHEYRTTTGVSPRALLIEGNGVLVAKDLTQSAKEILAGLAEVVRRLTETAGIKYLSQRRVNQVLNHLAYDGAAPKPPVKVGYAMVKFGAAGR